MKKKISLPMQILIALVLGVIVGLICYFTGTADFTASTRTTISGRKK